MRIWHCDARLQKSSLTTPLAETPGRVWTSLIAVKILEIMRQLELGDFTRV